MQAFVFIGYAPQLLDRLEGWEMDKVERDGRVAVLYSPGFGAGWSTWAHTAERSDTEWLLFAPELVEAVLAGDREKAGKLAKEKLPRMYLGGLDNLSVEWVPKGKAFRIDEYDGAESVEILSEMDFHTA